MKPTHTNGNAKNAYSTTNERKPATPGASPAAPTLGFYCQLWATTVSKGSSVICVCPIPESYGTR